MLGHVGACWPSSKEFLCSLSNRSTELWLTLNHKEQRLMVFATARTRVKNIVLLFNNGIVY